MPQTTATCMSAWLCSNEHFIFLLDICMSVADQVDSACAGRRLYPRSSAAACTCPCPDQTRPEHTPAGRVYGMVAHQNFLSANSRYNNKLLSSSSKKHGKRGERRTICSGHCSGQRRTSCAKQCNSLLEILIIWSECGQISVSRSIRNTNLMMSVRTSVTLTFGSRTQTPPI